MALFAFESMVGKHVISESIDVGNRVGGTVIFPQNRVLYADQFTGDAPEGAYEKKMISPRDISEVFAEFKPTKQGICLETREGGTVCEDMEFRSIEDFDDDNLICQSSTLSECEARIETLNAVMRNIQRNRSFISVMNCQEDRVALCEVIEAFINELSETI